MELFCPEDGNLLAFSDEEDDDANELIFSNSSFLSQAEDEYIETLVSKETAFSSPTHSSSGDRLHSERFESVRWILKMKSGFGFSSQTAYLAVTFLDRFLLRRTIDEGKIWAMKLLSIACLSLAAKMEECKPPFLSEYRFEGYRFSNKVIQRMELLVLDALEWRLNSVTPFTYLSYFASKFHFENCSRKLLPIAIRFIFVVVKAMNLIDYRPSTIAAAAILAASGEESTKRLFESNTNVFSLPEPSEREHIFTCYNAMIRESQKEKTISQKVLFSLEISSNCANLPNLNEFIDINNLSATSNKKKRLQSPHG
ncbi:cyclin-D5-3-like [Dendrobium catenatum]|uniref:Cyclin-D5-3 n=1 Tax=Dendrobium catenatum TaxID=906689 RepID=A0A2I0VZB8_9ASPA|nr:cyclin-D5-3-like [Dendrobium catenatum]PKU68748.1 Cyclin-D5-3 [Dendrobium catenatum]